MTPSGPFQSDTAAPDPFREAGLAGLVRVAVPLAGDAEGLGKRPVEAEPAFLDRLGSAHPDDRLVVRDLTGEEWTGLERSSHPPAFRVQRRGPDGALEASVPFRYPPRERSAEAETEADPSRVGGSLSRADACALAFLIRETALSTATEDTPGFEVAVSTTGTGAVLALDPSAASAARGRYGDRLVVDGRPLLASPPLAEAALVGYDPARSLDHGDVYGVPAPEELFRVEAHPKGWALAHQPEVARRRTGQSEE